MSGGRGFCQKKLCAAGKVLVTFGMSLSIQPTLLELKEVLQQERDIAKIAVFVTQTCIAAGFRHTYVHCFLFLINYLHPLLKSQMSRNHCTQTQPKLGSFCSD